MKHRDILISSVAATLAAAIMMIVALRDVLRRRRQRRSRRARNPIALIATIILAPIAAMLIQAAISRSREFDADAGGAAIAGSPHGLVSALRKIEAASARPDRRQPGHGAHVHHQAVLDGRLGVALQHASADRSADCCTAQRRG